MHNRNDVCTWLHTHKQSGSSQCMKCVWNVIGLAKDERSGTGIVECKAYIYSPLMWTGTLKWNCRLGCTNALNFRNVWIELNVVRNEFITYSLAATTGIKSLQTPVKMADCVLYKKLNQDTSFCRPSKWNYSMKWKTIKHFREKYYPCCFHSLCLCSVTSRQKKGAFSVTKVKKKIERQTLGSLRSREKLVYIFPSTAVTVTVVWVFPLLHISYVVV